MYIHKIATFCKRFIITTAFLFLQTSATIIVAIAKNVTPIDERYINDVAIPVLNAKILPSVLPKPALATTLKNSFQKNAIKTKIATLDIIVIILWRCLFFTEILSVPS